MPERPAASGPAYLRTSAYVTVTLASVPACMPCASMSPIVPRSGTSIRRRAHDFRSSRTRESTFSPVSKSVSVHSRMAS